MTTAESLNQAAPIGVFDSGIGGLSVLRHIRQRLPHERLIYFADSGFAPYGDKPEEVVIARSLAIADFLTRQGCKALVVACNTATAAAIDALRERFASIPVVGVEPGLKPAAAATLTGIVGVLATENTIGSRKFQALHERIAAITHKRFLLQPCHGLADQIEKGELHSPDTAILVRHYVLPLLEQGADTLVLGCTHYPFVRPLIEEVIAHVAHRPTTLVDTGEAVARQLVRLLPDSLQHGSEPTGKLEAVTTGSATSLATAFSQLLGQQPVITQLDAHTA